MKAPVRPAADLVPMAARPVSGKARSGHPRRLRFFAFSLGFVALVCLASGCREIAYYGQAAGGQLEIFRRQVPIRKVLREEQADAETRRRLALIGDLRCFAEERLSLEAGNHYTRYADLGRSHVVWNVYAAPAHSVEAHAWWYPIVGKQSYRGYFDLAGATNHAIRLKREGLDVYVGGVEAYSTLGWFRDPVLNTWIDRDDARLAALVFHELTHQRLYIAGDTAFNEAFATAVERAGVRLWLVENGSAAERKAWRQREARIDQFVQLVRQTRAALKAAYAAPDEAERAAGKVRVLAAFRERLRALQTEWGSPNAYRSWVEGTVNNARLNTVATYHDLVPGFLALLARHEQDFEAFYAAVRRLGRESKERRREVLNGLVAEKEASPTKLPGAKTPATN